MAIGVILPLAMVSAGVAGVAATTAAPPLVRTPGDSVLAQVGDLRQWAHIGGVASPDTTYLDVREDLILATSLDTLTLPWTESPATVLFARDADTLTAVFRFESGADLRMRGYVALLKEHSRFEPDPVARPPLDLAPLVGRAALDELRRAFPLDSIAGRGDDLSRMRNLRRWLHEHVRHDGSREGPAEATVTRNLQVCMEQGLTMHCGGLATSYTAICNAVGLPARSIVGKPFDADDPDCHSVSIVYSDSLEQWVYMDPSFDAEWSDDEGRPLDLQTARDRLVQGLAVVVNDDADVNGTPRPGPEHLAYMAKNLFRFQIWIDGRTPAHLVPCGYEVAADELAADELADGAAVVTHDRDWFWALPASEQATGR